MRTVLFIALLTAATPAAAQTGAGAATQQPAPAAQQGGAEQALIKLDRELMDATVSNDMALFKRTALDSYVFVNPGGGLEEGTQPPSGPPAKFESLVPEDVRVRVHGDTAVLTGRATVKGQLGSGRDISGQYRYLRVFVRLETR